MTHLVVSGKEVIKALLKDGFTFVRQTGSHQHLVKETTEKIFRVTIPVHGNKEINPFVLRSICRQAGYDWEEFQKLF